MKMKKLLLIGSNSIHLFNYHTLIKGSLDKIMVITNQQKYDYGHDQVFSTYFGLWNPFKLCRTIRFIKRKIKIFQPDIIHVHQINSYSFITILACRKMNIPIVLTAWGGDVLVNPWNNVFLRKMVTYCLKKASAITSDSLYMSFKIKELINGKNQIIETLNFGVNPPDTVQTKEKLVYSNRLHYEFYRIDYIIKAFNSFYQTNPDWRLVIAGEGPETQHLQSLVNSLKCKDAVDIVGWVKQDVNNDYYSKASIYVSIPTTDATSVSLLEALSYGCIPIVSNLPANLEWVMDDVNGLIVQNNDVDFISKALLLDTEQLAVLNRQIIERKALKKHSVKKFSSLYKTLIQGNICVE